MPRQKARNRETLAATRVAEWRKIRNLTQQQLADRAGITTGTVSAWENGENAPRVDQIEWLAEALGLELWEFYLGPATHIDRVAERVVEYGAHKEEPMPPLYDRIPYDGLDSATPAGGLPRLVDHLPHRACIMFRVADHELPPYRMGDVMLVDVSRTIPESGELVLAAVGFENARIYRALLHHGRMVLMRDPSKPMVVDGYRVQPLRILGVIWQLQESPAVHRGMPPHRIVRPLLIRVLCPDCLLEVALREDRTGEHPPGSWTSLAFGTTTATCHCGADVTVRDDELRQQWPPPWRD